MEPDPLRVREATPTSLVLTPDEAVLLARLGRELASNLKWWGGEAVDEGNRSIIDVQARGGELYHVVFRDVVGIVELGARQIHVCPKIAWSHFAFIASHSTCAPRTARDNAVVGTDRSFLELVCSWCVEAVEWLLKGGLRYDYKEQVEELSEVRGRVQIQDTMLALLRARPIAVCTFDELSEDSALNRVVKAAVQRIASNARINETLRRRARRVVFRMSGVGSLQPSDCRVRVDRVTRRYSTPIALSRLILEGCGISVREGTVRGTSFLFRTPQLIEDGMRALIAEYVPYLQVTKKKQMLGDSGLSMNPDVVIGGQEAVADVKYKFFNRDWNRADMYQAVAFATAYSSRRAAIIGFVGEDEARRPRQVMVGPVSLRTIAWHAAGNISVEEATKRFGIELRDWLQ